MGRGQGKAKDRSGRSAGTGFLAILLIVLGIWLAWQVVREALLVRLPPLVALQLAPGSPLVLSRAAEAEFDAGRKDAAAELARAALAKAPFDVRSLGFSGMVEAERGDAERGQALVTLAGNWSLRDGRAHLWLMERNLRQGEYGSGFAHADTLIRRRPHTQPVMFKLFTDVATADRRAVTALANTMRADPPWRPAFVAHSSRDPAGQVLAAELAIGLARSEAPFDAQERAALYTAFARAARFDGLRALRANLQGPADLVIDGGFEGHGGAGPLEWTYRPSPGFTAERARAPGEATGHALHLVGDGYSGGTATEQLLLLTPGSYRFRLRFRFDQGDPGDQISWTLACRPGGAPIAEVALRRSGLQRWSRAEGAFEVPVAGCGGQQLALKLEPGERRQSLELWVDDVAITPAS